MLSRKGYSSGFIPLLEREGLIYGEELSNCLAQVCLVDSEVCVAFFSNVEKQFIAQDTFRRYSFY